MKIAVTYDNGIFFSILEKQRILRFTKLNDNQVVSSYDDPTEPAGALAVSSSEQGVDTLTAAASAAVHRLLPLRQA